MRVVRAVQSPKGLRAASSSFSSASAKKRPAVEVDADALAGADAALGGDALLGELDHAGLGAGDQQPVMGDGVAHGPEPVAVQAGDHPAPVGGGDGRRPVPGLHHRVAVEEEVAVRLRHGGVAAQCSPG